MQRRRIIMELRNTGKLKGVKPCVIYLKRNMGNIYREGQADFVMTKNKNVLHFQKLSLFLRKLRPKEDFTIDLRIIKEYAFITKPFNNTLCLYDRNNRYIEIHYNKGISDTFTTEDNISRIIKELEEMGIKEINIEKDVMGDEEPDTEGKGSN